MNGNAGSRKGSERAVQGAVQRQWRVHVRQCRVKERQRKGSAGGSAAPVKGPCKAVRGQGKAVGKPKERCTSPAIIAAYARSICFPAGQRQ